METRPNQLSIALAEHQIDLATPLEAIRWGWEYLGQRCCVLSSMQDAVLVDLAMRVSKDIPIVFLDPGYHFAETWETLRAIESRYDVKVEVVGPLRPPRLDIAPGECCDDKSELLDLALRERDGWISGIRRNQTHHRAHASVVDRDKAGRVKINPIARWSAEDHTRFVSRAGIITNPLIEQGYPSVGCEPCTNRSAPDGDLRSGRWPGTDRVECGLHV